MISAGTSHLKHCRQLRLRNCLPVHCYSLRPAFSMATQQVAIPERAHAVLSYWFGPNYSKQTPEGSWPDETVSRKWFQGGAEVDQYIKQHFTEDVHNMRSGAYDDWLSLHPFSAMAGITLADQFTRNVYRGSADAFALDSKALSWASNLYDTGRVKELPPVMRQFVVLPYMHSESLRDQQRCVELVQAEYENSTAHDPESAATKAWADQLQFAIAHRNVVEKWGRFPHRNAVLGRQNSPQEEKGLAEGSIGRW